MTTPAKGYICPHCHSALLYSDGRGIHCDGCDKFNDETDLQPGRTPDEQAAHNHATQELFDAAANKVFTERADPLKHLASNTPLTDKEEGMEVYDQNGQPYTMLAVSSDFARKLERALTTARDALQEIVMCTPDPEKTGRYREGQLDAFDRTRKIAREGIAAIQMGDGQTASEIGQAAVACRDKFFASLPPGAATSGARQAYYHGFMDARNAWSTPPAANHKPADSSAACDKQNPAGFVNAAAKPSETSGATPRNEKVVTALEILGTANRQRHRTVHIGHVNALADEVDRLSRELAAVRAALAGAVKRSQDELDCRVANQDALRDAVRKSAGAEGADREAFELALAGRLEATRQALEKMVFIHENVDETGYVTDVGFYPVDDVLKEAHAILDGDAAKSTPGVDAADLRGYYRAKDEARNRYFEDGLQSFTKWLNEPARPHVVKPGEAKDGGPS